MTITVSQARKICNQSELDLVLLSTTTQIGNLDSKQVKAKMIRARALRDKWRDLSQKQIRVTKLDAPHKVDEANARTAAKAQLFAETLDRFTKRWEKLEPSEASPSEVGSKAAKPKRTAKHRAQRADVRTVLADAKDRLNVAASSNLASQPQMVGQAIETAEVATVNVAVKKTATPKKTVKKSVKKKGAKKVPKVSAARKKRASLPKVASVLPATVQRPLKDKSSATKKASERNMKAQAAAKSSAFLRGGVKSIRASVSAQGKRNQARRNKR